MISQPDGGTGLVYQAYAFGKYLGMAQLTFDDDGKVTNWSGNPILLDKSYQQGELSQEIRYYWISRTNKVSYVRKSDITG